VKPQALMVAPIHAMNRVRPPTALVSFHDLPTLHALKTEIPKFKTKNTSNKSAFIFLEC
jgi:hypothetical protein